jgi:SAM-dependent methyltransferase
MTATDLFGPFRVLASMSGAVIEREEPFQGFSGAVYARSVDRITTDLRWYLANAPRPAGTVLDLCCGSGRYLGAFVAAGWSGIGVDLVPAMLDRTAARLCAAGGQAQLHAADARTVDLDRRVDCVVIAGLSIAMFTPADRAAVLATARRHLRLGGALLLDYSPRRELAGDDTDVVGLPLRSPAATGFAWIGWERSDRLGRQRTNIYGEMISANGRTRRFLSTLTIELPSAAELTDELAEQGFRIQGQTELDPTTGARLPTRLLTCVAVR